ncbi:heterochromatin protein 1-like isoform X1 [Paramacrobiotus metropolitanus]|uniref:heterochromatin protein 1-like isoform X1 n=1 Tax=Paramacrobiotus metropolitanus TaxID=2943436 RepID=UPI00244642EE|nr:heterochromatin protein 1-like isoform X1 [Paramacrobiotus metropolitanus]
MLIKELSKAGTTVMAEKSTPPKSVCPATTEKPSTPTPKCPQTNGTDDPDEDCTMDSSYSDDARAVCMIDEEPYWLVEEIKDVKVDVKGKLTYLVKWVGYPDSVNSWEPEENCTLARRLIAEFHQRMSEGKRNLLAQQMLAQSRTNRPARTARRKHRKPDGFPPQRPRKTGKGNGKGLRKDNGDTDADSTYSTGNESGPSTCSSPTTSTG